MNSLSGIVTSEALNPSWLKKKIKFVEDAKNNNDDNLDTLTQNYIRYGHLLADINPLLTQKKNIAIPELLAKNFNVKQEDIEKLKQKFCGSIGIEIDHIFDKEEKKWILDKYDELFKVSLANDVKVKILNELMQGEGLETFLNSSFLGAKRFSIEGAESYLPIMETIIEYLAERGVFEVIIGMAHRGRLATLTNIAKKPYNQLMREFTGYTTVAKDFGSGDVKYHMGYESHRKFNNNTIKVGVLFNPSHLEAINPVGMGYVRARQDVYRDYGSRRSAALITVHGDGAFAGQGVNMETLQMSKLKAYNAGGVIHIVINNQVSFTADQSQAFGGKYCTDLAKIIEAPIFHVNGDDPEACFKIAKLAAMYKSNFCKDVVIELMCYRKYGHNEGDEPSYTQPIMYGEIKNKTSIAKIYNNILTENNVIDKNYAVNFNNNFKLMLENEKKLSETPITSKVEYDKTNIKYFTLNNSNTAISSDLFNLLSKAITSYPDTFNINSKIKKLLEVRVENLKNNIVDWTTAELIAYTSILYENHFVNLTGEDVERGTFSNRHAILTDAQNGKKYNLLNNIHLKQEYFSDISNSFLSEFGVLGFQYGYSLGDSNGLPIWEAQYGDFVNGAAIIIDQFISSGETKWLLRSNLTMLLPHGMEGSGPEHSSARLERFLQNCAENNWIIANCTTPANLFHILRRQVVAKHKIPLIIMTPKSGLRHKLNVSKISDFINKSEFMPIIGDNTLEKANINKIIVTSGKIYYDLFAKRHELNNQNTAIIRIEQYYPFPTEKLVLELQKYKNVKLIAWVQEESQNMGAGQFMIDYLYESIVNAGIKLKNPGTQIAKKYQHVCCNVYNETIYISRKASASPATGSHATHIIEQNEILSLAFEVGNN